MLAMVFQSRRRILSQQKHAKTADLQMCFMVYFLTVYLKMEVIIIYLDISTLFVFWVFPCISYITGYFMVYLFTISAKFYRASKEFMILPVGAASFREALQIGAEARRHPTR